MRLLNLLVILIILSNTTLSQKQPLDIEQLKKMGRGENWEFTMSHQITNNGRYAAYVEKKSHTESGSKLVIQSIDGNWRREIYNCNAPSFSDDNQFIVFLQGEDSLVIYALGTDNRKTISGVSSYDLIHSGKSNWLLMQMKKGVQLYQLKSGQTRIFEQVNRYELSQSKDFVILVKTTDAHTRLSWLNVATGIIREVWQGAGNIAYILNESGNKLAFLDDLGNDGKISTLDFYTQRKNELSIQHADIFKEGLTLKSLGCFSADGTQLFVDFAAPKPQASSRSGIKVDVWSYLDAEPQPKQLAELKGGITGSSPMDPTYTFVINLANGKSIRLTKQHERLFSFKGKETGWAYIIHRVGNSNEETWNSLNVPTYYLVSTATGTRRKLDFAVLYDDLSPDGKLLICYGISGDLISYEIETGKQINITKELPISVYDSTSDALPRARGLFVAAWLNNNRSVLVYDAYDIWKIDLYGKTGPICLTKGAGRKENIIFRLNRPLPLANIPVLKSTENLILSAFDNNTKDNGFYLLKPGAGKYPELLSKGPYLMYHPTVEGFAGLLLKAKDADVWLANRETASEPQNLFVTKNFRDFKQISSLNKERSYNWYTTKLVNFKKLNGEQGQGILYIPDDLDRSKKNPVIIFYYEKLTQRLNKYNTLNLSAGALSIPYFVSNGYIVFSPDLHFEQGKHAQSTVNTIVGAARHLMGIPWIDSGRIGLQGHSMGGYETYNLITHTNIFAAAAGAAGTVNLISHYNTVNEYHPFGNMQNFTERGQYRMGVSLWERPDLYIENSPIFNAPRVTTPLLIMHNKLDNRVEFDQGVQFFRALRRLGKKVWMLQYDGAGHSISNDEAAKDYTIRMKQFFDHYLKDKPAPIWMTRGISARFKGIQDGLQYDTMISTPGPGPLTEEAQRQSDSLRQHSPFAITKE